MRTSPKLAFNRVFKKQAYPHIQDGTLERHKPKHLGTTCSAMFNLLKKKNRRIKYPIRESEMRAFKNEHKFESITERWQAVDAYFECITSCDLSDGVCITMCMAKHLESGIESEDARGSE